MTVSELRTQIREAWAHAKYPDDARISDEASPRAMQVASFFHGKHWKDIALETLRACPGDASACLECMSAGAFQYYVPAYMLIALDRHENREEPSYSQAWTIAASAVYNLNPPPFGRFKIERLTLFSLPQRRAVTEYLRFIAGNCEEDYPMDEPRRALVYWLNSV